MTNLLQFKQVQAFLLQKNCIQLIVKKELARRFPSQKKIVLQIFKLEKQKPGILRIKKEQQFMEEVSIPQIMMLPKRTR